MTIKEIDLHSKCHYLFKKEEKEVFNLEKFPVSFVNDSLALLMRIHIYLLHKKDGFFLLTPAASNHQCHLYSLRLAQIKKLYGKKSLRECQQENEENCFLHLSFFLSFPFILHTPLYVKVVKKSLKELELSPPKPEKKFFLFCKDPGGNRVRAARKAYNDLFKTYIRNVFAEKKDTSQLYKELYFLAETEKLEVPDKKGKRMYYTLPKLAGVVHMVHVLSREKIAFALKVNIITNRGTGSFTLISGNPRPEDPVVIFESIATDGEQSIDTCRELAKKCFRYHRCHPSAKNRHSQKEHCLYCSPKKVDITPFKQRAKQVGKNPGEMLYALGADYVIEAQSQFRKIFEDKEKYPTLTKLFQKAALTIDKLGLSIRRPITFSVAFVYTDNGEFAVKNQMLMNQNPEELMKERGIL